MKVQLIPACHPKPTPTFQKAHIYEHKSSGLLYIGVYLDSKQYLVRVTDGALWSLDGPFGCAGASSFEDVTDKYILKGVE